MDIESRRLDWSLVQAFIAVAETGSLSAAARRLGLSQPTLGRQIRTLEDRLGAELFLRRPRGLDLSDAGTALIGPAREMGEAAARLRLAAEGHDESLSGTVRITSSVAMAQWHLPAIIARIRRDEPEIEIELVPSDESRNLLYREADIAIRMFRPTQLDLVARKLGEVPLGLYAAGDYLADKPPVTDMQDLLALDWVGYDTSPLLVDGMRAAGLDVDRQFFRTRCDDNATYWALMRAGCGVGIAQTSVAEQYTDLIRIDLAVQLPSLPVWLAAPEAIRHAPRIARVWDMLAEGLKPLFPRTAP